MKLCYSSHDILCYLNAYYLTIEQLSDRTHTPIDKILQYIEAQCLPTYSHLFNCHNHFSSPIFGEATLIEAINFYHPSLINWLDKIKKLESMLSLAEVAKILFQEFANAIRYHLQHMPEIPSCFNHYFDASGSLQHPVVESFIKEKWDYVVDGTYGVCLKQITPETIIMKAITVDKLERFIALNLPQLSETQKLELQSAINQYNQLVMPFAPHELKKSTRDRLVNKLKERYQME